MNKWFYTLAFYYHLLYSTHLQYIVAHDYSECFGYKFCTFALQRAAIRIQAYGYLLAADLSVENKMVLHLIQLF